MWVRMARPGFQPAQSSASASANAEVARVRLAAKRVERSRRPVPRGLEAACVVQRTDIAGVCQCAEPRSPANAPPGPWDWANGSDFDRSAVAGNTERRVGRDPVHGEDGRIRAARRRPEAVAEGFENALGGRCRRRRRRGGAWSSSRTREDRRCHGDGRHGRGCRGRRPDDRHRRSRSCVAHVGAGIDQDAGRRPGRRPRVRSAARSASGGFVVRWGRRSPSHCRSAAHPGDDPQPRIVATRRGHDGRSILVKIR